jgi:hypothetical protein
MHCLGAGTRVKKILLLGVQVGRATRGRGARRPAGLQAPAPAGAALGCRGVACSCAPPGAPPST